MFPTSRPVVLLPYQPGWVAEYEAMAQRIRALAGPAVVRIDHIGSTAVPGLSAKDVIDLQLTVADLAAVADLTQPLWQAGFRQAEAFQYDEFHYLPAADVEQRKLYMREPAGERRTHIHIREAGRFNARYALLFRDYLRANDRARAEYALAKHRAATLFPNSIDGYLFLKEPVFHLIYEAASLWADKVGWQLPADFQ
ncbi:GrpB family protein [Hymenobacter lucidus]|uniref:GrpB family protein n=1 Tax=Hymenobacter lucidus TaxID=2880930 RepID=A0ABS8ANZ4_9BACT|nr:GrpB family protein [Hymenobacter lucidus]MCB2407922.1 GrpB family protein [Hymenobacter lucidus]